MLLSEDASEGVYADDPPESDAVCGGGGGKMSLVAGTTMHSGRLDFCGVVKSAGTGGTGSLLNVARDRPRLDSAGECGEDGNTASELR